MTGESRTLEFPPLGGSYERAEETGAVVRPRSQFTFDVRLVDNQRTHETTFATDGDDYVGKCDCHAFRYGRVCAHLYALKRAERYGVIEVIDVSDSLGAPVCPRCGQEAKRE